MNDDEVLSLNELLAEVQRIELQSRKLVTDLLAGGYASVFRGMGIEFSEVREYVEGDDPRSVDWNVTARVGRPFIKKFIDERELTVQFVLDLSESMRAGFGAESSRHLAARFVALMGLAAARNQDKAGLLGFADDLLLEVPARKGMPHVLRLIREALVQRAKGQVTDLGTVLEHLERVQRRRAVLFIISDFQAPLPTLGLGRLAKRHDVVAVRVNPPEQRVPRRGMMRVRDPETGILQWVDFSSARVRRIYAANVQALKDHQDAQFQEARIDCLDLEVPAKPDGDSLVKPLLRFFRMRELRGAKR